MSETKTTAAAAAKAQEDPRKILTLEQKFVELRKAVPAIIQKQHSDGKLYPVVAFDGLNACQMRTACSCEIFNKDSHARVSDTVKYSIESYAKTMSTSADAALVNLIYAMMKYGDSAAAYCN